MSKNTDNILKAFREQFCPQTLPVAENIFGKFAAGESFYDLTIDYEIGEHAIETAIRFFILIQRGNKQAKALYSEYEQKRFGQLK